MKSKNKENLIGNKVNKVNKGEHNARADITWPSLDLQPINLNNLGSFVPLVSQKELDLLWNESLWDDE